MNKKNLFFVMGFALVVFVLLGVLVMATTIVMSPATRGNYTTTINFSTNTTILAAMNVTVSYNFTDGGTVMTFLFYQYNTTTEDQLVFENGSYSITGLPDSLYYNFSFLVVNLSSDNESYSVSGITIDNTKPNVTDFVNTIAYGNYSSNFLVLNASVIDNIMGVETTGVKFNLTNSSGEQNWSMLYATGSGDYYYNHTTLNVTVLVEDRYNITVWANDTLLGNLNNSEKIQITVDRTSPYEVNITTVVTRGNYSGNTVLNSTAVDLLAGVESIYFNITNSSGKQNTTATGIKTSGFWNVSFNTSIVPDGKYNITIWVNDSSGNLNNTRNAIDITFDNTPPAVANFTTTVAYGNYSFNYIVLNISVLDPTMGPEATAVRFNVTNSSGFQNWSILSSTNVTEYYYNHTTLNVTVLVEGRYNITVWANDTLLNNLNNSESIQITIDRTSPNEVNMSNITTTISTLGTYLPSQNSTYSGNYSGTITLNASLLDALAGGDTVFFNITNSSGDQNATATGTRSGNYWSTTFNTSTVAEGFYNITIWGNDSSGNLNNTHTIKNVYFENTAPVVTATKSSSSTKDSLTLDISITEDGSETSFCEVSRGTATITGAGNGYTSVETGLGCGTSYTYTISCIDYSGNNGSMAATAFTTDACTGGASGGGGGTTTTWTNTYNYADEELSSKGTVTKSFGSKSRAKLKVGGETHYVGVKSLTSSTATIEVSSTPQTITLSIGEIEKFDVTDDEFYDLSVRLDSIANNKADITITYIQETIPSLSPEEEAVEEEIAEEAEEPPPEEKEKSYAWLWIFLIALFIIVGISVAVKKKKK